MFQRRILNEINDLGFASESPGGRGGSEGAGLDVEPRWLRGDPSKLGERKLGTR